jgi:glutathione S-transferase
MPGGRRDQVAIAAHLAATTQRFALLDRELAARPWLAGDRFTMADIPAGMTLYRWFEMEIPRPPMPHVEAWYARLCGRPAYRTAVCVPFDDLIGKESY